MFFSPLMSLPQADFIQKFLKNNFSTPVYTRYFAWIPNIVCNISFLFNSLFF